MWSVIYFCFLPTKHWNSTYRGILYHCYQKSRCIAPSRNILIGEICWSPALIDVLNQLLKSARVVLNISSVLSSYIFFCRYTYVRNASLNPRYGIIFGCYVRWFETCYNPWTKDHCSLELSSCGRNCCFCVFVDSNIYLSLCINLYNLEDSTFDENQHIAFRQNVS